MKQIFKLIGGLLVGAAIGFSISTLFVVLATDLTLTEFLAKFKSIDFLEISGIILFSIASFAIAVSVHIVCHEGGHLIAGLLSGYKFISFRIFNFTLLKSNGKYRLKRFKIAGTGGQCLLTPPDRPVEEINTNLYNAGGFLVNLILSAVAITLFFLCSAPLAKTFCFIFALTGLFMAIINGIPVKVGGMTNDGYNIKMLNKNLSAKRAMCIQLWANALIQEGVRPSTMNKEWFETAEENFDYSDHIQLTTKLMKASYVMDCGNMEEAHQILAEAWNNRDKIIPLFVKEIACELIFTSLTTGRIEFAKELLTEEIKKYLEQYRKVMSSKERILFAIELLLNHNTAAAQEILNSLINRKEQYLLQGEVNMDIGLCEELVRGYDS
ncbi:MAG: hypothetical protein IKY70_00630 [Bacteroidales bacterium]|nr:hypothetical protein [Bacteroidales bacterium]